MTALRDSFRFGIELPRGVRSSIASPQVTLVSAGKDDPADPAMPVTVNLDLLVRASSSHAWSGMQPTVNPAFLDGVINQVAEQLAFETSTGTDPTSSVTQAIFGPTVGDVFRAAADAQVPVVALDDVADLSTLNLTIPALARIRTVLETGLVVVTPQSSVEIGGASRSGWWLIDPVTGTTRDELDTGRGSASLNLLLPVDLGLGPMGEDADLTMTVEVKSAEQYRSVGARIQCIVLMTRYVLGFTLPSAGAGFIARALEYPNLLRMC